MDFQEWSYLADIGDWSELCHITNKFRHITEKGVRSDDIIRIIGHIVNRYYKNKRCCRLLGSSYPKRLVHDLISTAVSMSADQGQSVLTASHVLCCGDNQDSSLTLEVLLDWFSDNFDYSDMKRLFFDTTRGKGYNAIDQCWVFCLFKMRVGTHFHISAQRLQFTSKHIKTALKKTKLIADAVLESSMETPSFLNALLMSPCPNIAVHAALHLDEDDPSGNKNVAQCRKFDENDNLPLHLAAMNPVHHELFGTVAGDSGILEVLFAKPAIQTVLDVYPAAARTANGAGCIPLNLVLENYHKWSLDQAKRRSQRRDSQLYAARRPFQLACQLDNAILELVKAAPEALQARDQKTHMYPFMLAASNKEVPLDLVYSLLRKNPMAVHCAINKTINEMHPNKKLDQSSLQVQELQLQVDQQQVQSNRLKRKRGDDEEGAETKDGSNKRGRGMHG